MMFRRQTDTASLCDQNCTYRRLYEGSQASMASLADVNIAAMGRVDRLRRSLIRQMQLTFPRRFEQIERERGIRFSKMTDDEVLMWHHQLFVERAQKRGLVDAPDSTSAATSSSTSVDEPAASPLSSPTDGASSLADLFADGPAVNDSPAEPAPTVDVFTSGSGPGSDIVGVDAVDPWDDDFTGGGPGADDADEMDPWDVPFGDDPEPAVTYETVEEPDVGSEAAAGSDSPSDAPAATSAATPERAGPHALPAGGSVEVGVQPKAPASQSLADLFDTAPATPPARSPRVLPAPPLRPQAPAVPARRGRRKKNAPHSGQIRLVPAVTATRPGDIVEPSAAGDGPPETVAASLLARVMVASPVFERDLDPIAGDRATVEAWVEQERSRDDSQIRFLNPKRRFVERGRLLIPRDPGLLPAGKLHERLWVDVLSDSRVRGATMYDLAVLVQALGANVHTYDLSGDVLTFQVMQNRVMTALVVPRRDVDLTAGSDGRVELGAAIGKLLDSRFDSLCVLAFTEQSAPELTSVVQDLAGEYRWQPAFPVVLHTVGGWASRTGAAVQLLDT